jgi:hypothetical protein
MRILAPPRFGNPARSDISAKVADEDRFVHQDESSLAKTPILNNIRIVVS